MRWVQRLRQEPPRSSLLPLKRSDGVFRLVAIAFTEQEASDLAAVLVGFIGPTWSAFAGYRAPLDSSDEISHAVRAYTYGHGFLIDVDRNATKEIQEALDLLYGFLASAPPRATTQSRSVGRVLRDFHMALRAGDEEVAEADLQHLTEQGLLEPLNLAYLRVQLLAELGHREQLLSLPVLAEILQIRSRPAAVTRALISAVHERYVAPRIVTGEPVNVIAAFRDEVLPQFFGLFVGQPASMQPEALLGDLLAGVAGIGPLERAQEAGSRLQNHADMIPTSVLKGLIDQLPRAARHPKSDPSVLARAGQALVEGDPVQALELALGESASGEALAVACDAALQIGTLDAQRRALQFAAAASSDVRSAFLVSPRNRLGYEALQRAGTPASEVATLVLPPPDGWAAWLDCLNRGKKTSRALEEARAGEAEWPILGDLQTARDVRSFVAGIRTTRDSDCQEVFDCALPHLLGALQQDTEWPRRDHADIYLALAESLVVQMVERVARNDFDVLGSLLSSVLGTGAQMKDYRDLVGSVRDVVVAQGAPIYFDSILDVLDVLVTHPCPDPNARLALATVVLDLAQRMGRRLDSGKRQLLRDLFSDLDEAAAADAVLPIPPPTVERLDDDPFWLLRGRSVGIYTLTPSVGQRLIAILPRLAPGVRVSLSEDRVSTAKLVQMAKNSDVMIVVTRSAKHAATNAIYTHRPRGAPLLEAPGRGTASILAALREHLSRSGLAAKSS
jgi:hypothetical protein